MSTGRAACPPFPHNTQKAESWGGALGITQGREPNENLPSHRSRHRPSKPAVGSALPSGAAASPLLAACPLPDHTGGEPGVVRAPRPPAVTRQVSGPAPGPTWLPLGWQGHPSPTPFLNEKGEATPRLLEKKSGLQRGPALHSEGPHESHAENSGYHFQTGNQFGAEIRVERL